LTTEDDSSTGYIETARAVWPEMAKPMAMLSNLASAVDRADVLRLAEAGIPVLEGTSTGLAAFRHLFAYRDARARPPVAAAPEDAPPPTDVRAGWRARLASGEPFGEAESLALLGDYGVPVCA